MGPVRVGNQDGKPEAERCLCSVVLAATQMFVDERLPRMETKRYSGCLRGLANEPLSTPSSPMRVYGNIVPERCHTPIRRRYVGRPVTGSLALRADLESRIAPNIGRPRAFTARAHFEGRLG